jgi:hypothetical protein
MLARAQSAAGPVTATLVPPARTAAFAQKAAISVEYAAIPDADVATRSSLSVAMATLLTATPPTTDNPTLAAAVINFHFSIYLPPQKKLEQNKTPKHLNAAGMLQDQRYPVNNIIPPVAAKPDRCRQEPVPCAWRNVIKYYFDRQAVSHLF